MERIYTWIHENYMKHLEKIAEKWGESKYKVAQYFIEKGLDELREREKGVTIFYWFFVYALAVMAVLLVLF